MPRRIEDGVSLLLSLEVSPPHLNSDTLRPLLLIRVHDISHVPALAVLLLCLLLILFNCTLVHPTGEEEDLASQCALSCVDVSDEDNIEMIPD